MTKATRRDRRPPVEPETVASAMEQTGLIPSLPEDEDESAAYEALYPIPRQQENTRPRR